MRREFDFEDGDLMDGDELDKMIQACLIKNDGREDNFKNLTHEEVDFLLHSNILYNLC